MQHDQEFWSQNQNHLHHLGVPKVSTDPKPQELMAAPQLSTSFRLLPPAGQAIYLAFMRLLAGALQGNRIMLSMAPQHQTVVAIDELRAAASQDQAIEADYAIWLVRLAALTALQTAVLLALIEVETQCLSQLEGYDEASQLAAFNYDFPTLAIMSAEAMDHVANYPTMDWGHKRPPTACASASTGDPEPAPVIPMPCDAVHVLDSPLGSPRERC